MSLVEGDELARPFCGLPAERGGHRERRRRDQAVLDPLDDGERGQLVDERRAERALHKAHHPEDPVEAGDPLVPGPAVGARGRVLMGDQHTAAVPEQDAVDVRLERRAGTGGVRDRVDPRAHRGVLDAFAEAEL